METVKDTQTRIIKTAVILFLILSALSLIMITEPIPVVIGLFLGSVTSVLNFRLMFITAVKAVQMLPHHAQSYTVRRYMIRYVITGVVLYLAATEDHINILGVIVGLFSIKWAIIKSELFKVSFLKDIFKRKEEN